MIPWCVGLAPRRFECRLAQTASTLQKSGTKMGNSRVNFEPGCNGLFPNEIKWILEIEAHNGTTGIGETYRGATEESVTDAIKKMLGTDFLCLNWRRFPTEDSRVYDALESVGLDLAGKVLQLPAYQLLGGAYRHSIECTGWTGKRTPEDAARKAQEALSRGHRVFKFKCSEGDPVREWSAEIARRSGKQIKILLDPNQRWRDVETTLRLMDGVDRECMFGLEDPIERTNYPGFRELRERLGIPVFVHVSLPYGRQLQRSEDTLVAIRECAVDGFNFNGSMFEFVSLAKIAELSELPCWHGSEVDLGILEASALHACAAAAACTLPSDLLGELVSVNDLIAEPIRFDKGYALVPQGPGLGVTLDREALEQHRAGKSISM